MDMKWCPFCYVPMRFIGYEHYHGAILPTYYCLACEEFYVIFEGKAKHLNLEGG